jgi:hypothetical protein
MTDDKNTRPTFLRAHHLSLSANLPIELMKIHWEMRHNIQCLPGLESSSLEKAWKWILEDF